MHACNSEYYQTQNEVGAYFFTEAPKWQDKRTSGVNINQILGLCSPVRGKDSFHGLMTSHDPANHEV